MDLINNIKSKPFVVFGRAGIDLFAEPVGTSAELAETFRSDVGGSSANICVGLCKLGYSSALVTSVSDDVVGRFCLKRLQHYGVDPCVHALHHCLAVHGCLDRGQPLLVARVHD